MHIPPSILRRAAQAHGLTRKHDLLRAGLSASAIDRLVAHGVLERLHPGVYRVCGAPKSWSQRQLAACWAAGGVASHRAAARLWGFDLEVHVPVELTVGRSRSPKPCGAVVHRSGDVEAGRTIRRDGVPVTDPLRVLADLGAVVEPYVVAHALDACVVAKLVTVAGVRAEVARLSTRGRRGVGVLRAVVDDWPLADVRPDSVLEPRFARLCRRAGLPRLVFQHEIVVGGRRRRIDFSYPHRLIAVEVDGFASRVDPRVFRDERARQNDLVTAGWTIARFTWFDVMYRPSHVGATLADVLGMRITA